MPPKWYAQMQGPGTCKCDLVWENDLCRWPEVKDLEMRSSWIIKMGSKSNDKRPYERHTEERHRRRRHAKTGQRPGRCGHEPGAPGAARGGTSRGRAPPTPQSRRERGPAGTGAAIPSSRLQNRGEMRLLHFLTPCSVLGPGLCILYIIVLRGH